jgi:sugar phosphate isomerase/epimerase
MDVDITRPVALVGLACSERLDSPDACGLKASIEAAKAYVKLSYDVGCRGLRVFPDDFQKGVPEEKTIEQIGDWLSGLGKYAAGYGQMIRLENHGSAGRLVMLRKAWEELVARAL